MGYNTVFEIGFRSFPWGMPFHAVPFILIGLLLFRFGRGSQISQATGVIVAALAALFVLIAATSLVPKFVEVRHTYKTGNSSFVEGIVQNFHAAPALGASEESFSVRGVEFSYNALDPTACFHNAPFRKGPIRAGLDVRILYQDGCIQRLDIGK